MNQTMNIKFINDQKRALKLSNPRISQLTGITLPTLNKITAGANTNPTLDTLQALATALQCTIDDLAYDADEGRYSADARRLALDFDKLDPRGQRVVRRCMDAELDELHSAQPIYDPATNYADAVQAVTAALPPDAGEGSAKAHA